MRARIVAPPFQLGQVGCPAPERNDRTDSGQYGENAVILPGFTDHWVQYLVADIPGMPSWRNCPTQSGGGEPGKPANRAA